MLDEIATKYGTDKRAAEHNYTRIYEQLFADRESVQKLVEIGVHEGKSLRMWAEWFPNALVFGVDNFSEQTFAPPDDSRMRVLAKDQSRIDDLIDVARTVGRDVDAVIDDGSHLSRDQLLTFQVLWPCVRPGGVYVIEDLHTSYYPDFTNGMTVRTTEWLKRLVDVVNWRGHGGGDPPEAQVPSSALTTLEQQIESVHFMKSLAILHKRARPRR